MTERKVLQRGRLRNLIFQAAILTVTLPFTVTVKYSLKNNQLTYITQSVNFTPLTKTQASKFSYLTKPAEVLPDVYDDEPTSPSINETPTDSSSAENNASNAEQNNIPNTNRANSKSAVIAGIVILLSGSFAISVTVFRKRRISE